MHYKSTDANFMKPKKEYIFNNDEDPDYSWGFFRKHVYLNDLFEYARSLFPNQEIERGAGNLNANIVVVVDSMKNKPVLDLLKLVLSKVNINYNDIYITSYQKVGNGRMPELDNLLEMELKAIKPKAVYSIGDFGIVANGFDLSTEDVNIVDNIVSMDTQFNKKATPTPEEENELKENKKHFFKHIKYLIRYMLL